MRIKKPDDIASSEITPERLYLSRRAWLRGAAAVGGTALAAVGFRQLVPGARRAAVLPPRAPEVEAEIEHIAAKQTERGDTPTSFEAIAGYNNYYEFSTDKYEVAEVARGWKPVSPWTVVVEGEVARPRTLGLEDILRLSPPQERIYRMRCVEGWSMVIPWLGSPLGALLRALEPTSNAKFVELTTVVDEDGMPNQRRDDVLEWPYVEGLRLDEAMHDLTLLATGIYGQPLLPQNGAPLRLVVPWKYGFKGVKSIVKIALRRDQPISTWTRSNSDEYGFYSNVNPDVPHPRWSQRKERRIGETDKRPTLMFNGYGEQVASLYTGMDLVANF